MWDRETALTETETKKPCHPAASDSRREDWPKGVSRIGYFRIEHFGV
jgi:hypothetical protein